MKLFLIQSIRTNNFNDMNMPDKIKTMWEEASRKLENHQSNVYGIYYDYESNYKGDYSLSVAIGENNGESFIDIPENEKYEVFKVDSSDEQGIFATWRNIWEQEEAGLLNRAYSFDFEKYDPNGKIEVHIAIR